MRAIRSFTFAVIICMCPQVVWAISTTLVKKGENLLDVAKRCQTTTNDLITLNKLQKPYQIYIGQPLKYSTKKTETKHNDDNEPQTVKNELKRSASDFSWPVEGSLISGFGKKQMGKKNDGINIAVKFQTPVKAAEDGTVVYAGNEIRGFGNMLLIKHADNWSSTYAHNDILLVKKGDTVKRGQIIAKAGNTGQVDAPQVHFELRQRAKPVDPLKYLK